jgi:hypothetical protein
MARLSGLDKDSVRVALAGLAGEGVVEVEQRSGGDPRDPRRSTWLRVRADLYARPGEPQVLFPAELAYGGFWAGLPGEAARHLVIAWAALPADANAPPERSLSSVERRLLGLSGMGRTAFRRASASLIAWRGARGARLIVRRDGRYRAHLAAPLRALRPLPPRAARPPSSRPEVASIPIAEAPPLDGDLTWEARKAWWIRRYLPAWAARALWSRRDPARPVFVDLCPGSASNGLPAGLAAALEMARSISGPKQTGGEALRVMVVEPDAGRREELRRASAEAGLELALFPDTPEGFIERVYPWRTADDAAQRGRVALLFFVGQAEAPAVEPRRLGLVATGGREAVALTHSTILDAGGARLWCGRRDAEGHAEARSVAAVAQSATRAGIRNVLALPLLGDGASPAGTLVHLSGDPVALVAWKRAVGGRRKPQPDTFAPASWPDLVGAADLAEHHFRGREVGWRTVDRDSSSVREFYLRRTPLLPGDLAAVRREFVRRGYRVGSQPFVYSFPAETHRPDHRSVADQ